ncbi:MAG: 3-oxoacyl-[acyl-carrier-protein] synthase III C-terminal domain-containing protein [Pseudomonadota bacterium]|nr:3-oxoacyl-[acyl-carrier-protein] synthase III C-terminal domain-containing protein [Pseudomonadota bacterium]
MTVTRTGIRSFGAYLPRRRLQRAAIAAAHAWALPGLKGMAKGERTMCAWDEDAITMAVEAGRDALRGHDRAKVAGVTLASTTAPYADLQNAVLVNAALSLDATAGAADQSGSTRAGLAALIQACDGSRPRLVIGSERRLAKPGSAQEMSFGCGAAALLTGSGEDLIARFVGSESRSIPFIDHFRQSAEKHGYHWEERWIRDEGISGIVPQAISALLKRLGRSAADVACFGLSGGIAGTDKLVAKQLGIAPDRLLPDLQAQVGDTGAAHALLQLVAALERAKPGDLIVVAAFAQGCETLAFEMLAEPTATGRRGLAGSLAQRVEETSYLKMLSFDGELQLEWGMRAETDNKTALTQLYRSANQIFGFSGGRCGVCGTVQFPRMPACVNCGAIDSQQPHALAEEPAQVATYTADWLQYSQSPPLYMGLVQFDVGARLLMEIVDVGSAGIDVGTPLEMRLRIKERDGLRHFDRYFWKATPPH